MKKLLTVSFLNVVFLAALASAPMAGHHYHGCSSMMMNDMTEMDTDNSGFITLDEFSEPFMEKYRGWFKMLDTDDDGYLSQEEWDAFRNAHGYGESSES